MEGDGGREKVRGSCVCNEDRVNPVNFFWEWGEGELSIVDRYTHLGVGVSKDCSWDTHVAKLIGKDKITRR